MHLYQEEFRLKSLPIFLLGIKAYPAALVVLLTDAHLSHRESVVTQGEGPNEITLTEVAHSKPSGNYLWQLRLTCIGIKSCLLWPQC